MGGDPQKMGGCVGWRDACARCFHVWSGMLIVVVCVCVCVCACECVCVCVYLCMCV